MPAFISPKATIEKGSYIGNNVAILGETHIGSGTIIEDNCIIGKPSRSQMEKLKEIIVEQDRVGGSYVIYDSVVNTITSIGKFVQLQRGTTIYSGVTLDDGVICEDNCLIRWDTRIGANTKLMFGAFVGSYVTIGSFCRIGGFCGNDVSIGDYSSVFGDLIHSSTKYGGGRRERAPKVGNRVTIGFGAQIVGDVSVDAGSYIAAGSLVTKDVPANVVVTLFNVQCPLDKWEGSLREQYIASFPDE
jgi:UDP-3-O-[3-hydroxymyristoyl] glucosamine N-acyltransferase